MKEPVRDTHWEGVRLHIVSGKGGTGKTTVAAALAIALAEGGGKVLLLEVEGRQGIAQLFDTPPLPYEERWVASAPGGGEVIGLAVDPEEALLEYLEMFYNLRRAGSALRKLGAIDFATTIAPGLRDVLLTGKAIEAVKRRTGATPVYTAVVLDAPPTGRITRFLNVNAEVAGLAKAGPIHKQAESVMGVLRSPRTAVHLVTVLEEMPVQETADGIAQLGEAELPVGGVVLNMTRDPLLGDADLWAAGAGSLDRELVTAGITAAGVTRSDAVNDALVSGLLAGAAEHAERVSLEQREREVLAGLRRPLAELPWIGGGIDLGALYTLAARLREQGMA